MNSRESNRSWFSSAKEIVTRLAEERSRKNQVGSPDPANLYSVVLCSLVDFLLSTPSVSESPFDSALAEPIDQLPLALPSKPTAEEVGRLYEYLRGFKLELIPGQQPALVPCVKGKRNQGLFYTPPAIVKHIVGRTLDALDIRDPQDYLSLRIVDPAMGTAAFLVEALEQITSRVTTCRSPLKSTQDVTDVRRSILENNLYGIEIDPIAVRIAQAVLRERVLAGTEESSAEIRLHLQQGNALMGEIQGGNRSIEKGMADEAHFHAYFGHTPGEKKDVSGWVNMKQVFHWPIEFPEVFSGERGGFDAVVGNPPYEVFSVKESGIDERRGDQEYFRRTYRMCHGKINTYRLMMERAMDLLRDGGILGFIVPATFMADSTAEHLRRLMMDQSRIVEAVVIPEKARVFDGVTQALLILIARKGSRTHTIAPILWNGDGPIPDKGPGEIDRRVLAHTGSRIPLLRDESDKRLLQELTRHPRLAGSGSVPRLVTVHQGEINLTVHREYVTSQQTNFQLIRGEHVAPFHVVHPCRGAKRLDWVLGESFLGDGARRDNRRRKRDRRLTEESDRFRARGTPWEKERIVLARVVNMGTDRRLKAALVPARAFLGDMTNFIAEPAVPIPYLLGLLNSRLLNWRFKLTSTNNYISAREIEDLPAPRPPSVESRGDTDFRGQLWLEQVIDGTGRTIGECIALLSDMPGSGSDQGTERWIFSMIERTVELVTADAHYSTDSLMARLWNLLDALVLKLYGVEEYVEVIERR